MQGNGSIDQATPMEAFQGLKDRESALIDVRTRAEWAFVGLPDISDTGRPLATVEWVDFPSGMPNPQFYETLGSALGGTLPATLYFICRSGARSMAAARLVAERAGADGLDVRCVNVAEGFEGDLDQGGHRGRTNGWKVAGLPWRQS